MFYALLAALLLTYPLYCLIMFGFLKGIEFLVNRLRAPKRINPITIPVIFAVLSFPVHYFDPGSYDQMEITLPLWFSIMTIARDGGLNFLYPETLFRTGHDWLSYAPGLMFQLIWLVFVIYLFRKKTKSTNNP